MNHHLAAGCRFAAVLVLAALAACHDSGSDAAKAAPGPAPAPASPGAPRAPAATAAKPAGAPAAGPQTFAIARLVPQGGAVGSRDQKSTLYVADPAKPETPAQAIAMDGGAVTAFGLPGVFSTQAFRVDRATRRINYDGESMVLFVKDSKVWKIELRSDLPHTPVQVSSLAKACRLSIEIEPLRISADGRDVWVKIDVPGASGACAQVNDSVFVRSTMPATAPPLPKLPGDYVDALDDGAQGMVSYLMQTPAGLELYRPDFTRIGPVEGGADVHVIQPMGYDFSTLQASYYRVDGKLRRLAWTPAAATLAPPIYSFAGADFGQRNVTCHSDVDAFYFADNNKLMKVVGAGQPSEIATLPGLPLYAIFVSETHLALYQADPASPRSPPSVAAIDKHGGPSMSVKNAQFIGATPTRVVYRMGRATHAIKFDGTGDIVLGESPVLGSNVHASQWIADNHYIESYVACEPANAADKQCANGRIVQTNLETLAKTEVGAVSHTAPVASSTLRYGNLAMGMPIPLASGVATFFSYTAAPAGGGARSAGMTDIYSWTPGKANSLVRLTSQIP